MKHFFQQRTTARDLTVGMTITIAVVTALMGLANYTYFNSIARQELESKATEISDHLNDILALPLWNLDIDKINDIAPAYLERDDVVGLRIVDKNGVTLFNADAPASTDLIYRSQTVFYDQKKIGLIELALTATKYKRIQESAFYSTGFFMVLMIVSMLVVIRRLLNEYHREPITGLTQGINIIAGGDYAHRIPKVKQADINEIIDEINIMAEAIEFRDGALQEAKQELEERVADRTAKLMTANKKLRDEINERKQAEAGLHQTTRALQNVHSQTEQLLSSISSILIGVSRPDTITRWNKAAEKIFGLEAGAVVGGPFVNCGIKWDWGEVLIRISDCLDADEATQLHDIHFTRPDGREGVLNVTISPIRTEDEINAGYLLLATEVTEQKNLENQLSQAQKLKSIGQLAAGIAHEINTPIQYIGDNTRFLQIAFRKVTTVLQKKNELMKLARENSLTTEFLREVETTIAMEKLDYMLDEIPMAIDDTLGGVAHVATIVRAIKEFSHPGTGNKTLTDINKALESTVLVARNEWKYVAQLVKELDPAIPPVPCLPGDLNQVFLNIIVNAAHAISDASSFKPDTMGIIKISTCCSDDNVEIRISDSGDGIPAEIGQRIFDPFFTTKKEGRGSGQGLAISHNVIVEKHGGSIRYESELEKGTTFIINLPVEDQHSEKIA